MDTEPTPIKTPKRKSTKIESTVDAFSELNRNYATKPESVRGLNDYAYETSISKVIERETATVELQPPKL